MKLSPLILVATLTALAGCSTNPTKQEIGMATGAVIGGAAGAVLTGGSTLGTVGGAAVGGVIGNHVGKDLEGRK
jgi:osmotically inducible lipoprotein OsmB